MTTFSFCCRCCCCFFWFFVLFCRFGLIQLVDVKAEGHTTICFFDICIVVSGFYLCHSYSLLFFFFLHRLLLLLLFCFFFVFFAAAGGVVEGWTSVLRIEEREKRLRRTIPHTHSGGVVWGWYWYELGKPFLFFSQYCILSLLSVMYLLSLLILPLASCE